MSKTITISIPKGFEHHAAIYKKWKPPIDKYGIALPATDEFKTCTIRSNGVVHASSEKQPIIVIGNDTMAEQSAWQQLMFKAERYRIPFDTLLIDRPLEVACRIWTPSGPFARGKDGITLIAVKILGDLTKSLLLDERIEEIKGWFE